MRHLIVVVGVLLGCTSKDKVPPAPPPAPVARAVEVKPCAPLPAGERDDSLDLDGDGTNDVLVPVAGAHCDKYECPKTVYLVRGACAQAAGVISVGYSADVKVGAGALTVDGLGGTAVYRFDGTQYVRTGETQTVIGRPDDPLLVIANLGRARDPKFLATLLADRVKVHDCGHERELDRAATVALLTQHPFWVPGGHTCAGGCCELADTDGSRPPTAIAIAKVCTTNRAIGALWTPSCVL